MQAQLTHRTQLSLVLGLLLLSVTVAMRGCSNSYRQLLSQLQRQANITKDTSSLLEPYIRLQGLDMPPLRASCTEWPGTFPSEDALRALSKQALLRTIHTTLGRVLQGLATIWQQLLENQSLAELEMTRQNIQGIRNNIHCMSWLLNSSLETPEPTKAGPGASLPPTHRPVFQAKKEGCRFLWGYHRFMGLVGQIFREWGDSPSRSRRHSPRWAWHKGSPRTRPSRRGRRPMGSMPRGQWPQ